MPREKLHYMTKTHLCNMGWSMESKIKQH